MARIYSTSYFHYTRNFANLVGILQNGFVGSYCEENFKWNGNVLSLYMPVISFCDLPLSHIDKMTYGDYAIGMSSVWGNATNITPICYFPNNQRNSLTKYISKLAYDFCQTNASKGIQLLAYAKPKNKYKNPNKHPLDNYKERECRRVYLNGITTDCGMHGQLCPQLVLPFSADDVTFIIVKDEQDRSSLIQQIPQWSQVGGIQSFNNLPLCSKILTKQEIRNNF